MKKLLLTVLSLIMILGTLLALASCDRGTPPPDDDPPANGDFPENWINIFYNGKTDYSVAYSNGIDEVYAYRLIKYIRGSLGYIDLNEYEYKDDTNEKEIIIGDTDRQISKDLKTQAEALLESDDDFIWAYGYKDGKLAFYANSEYAYELAWDEFYSTIVKGDVIGCPDELWVVGIKTYADYQQELIDAANKMEQQIMDNINAGLKTFEGKSFGNPTTEINKFISKNKWDTPTVRPIASHPRVWVNSTRLEEVKKNLLTAENKAIYDEMKKAADEAAKQDGKLVYNSNGNYSSKKMVSIETLAFMYLVTGEEKYGKAAILHSLNFMDTYVKRPDGKSGDTDNAYKNSLNGGSAIYIMAEVYDWCYDLLTEEQKDQLVVGSCLKYAVNLEMGYPPSLQNGVQGHGTGTQFVRNWLAFAIAIEDEYPEMYDFVVGRLQAEYVKAPEEYYLSGMNFHGAPYGAGKTQVSEAGQILFEIATGEELFKGVDFVFVTHSYLHRLRPDDEMIRVGDDYACGGKTYSMSNYMWLSFLTATYYNDPLSKTWYKHWSENYNFNTMSSNDEATPAMFLLLNDTDTATLDDRYSELDLVYYTKSPLSSLVVRSAWGDPGAWMTFTNMTETHLGNHQHKDVGTFQIYYKGILAPDSGIYQHGLGQAYGSVLDQSYVKQTVSKNGLLIYNPNMSDNGKQAYSGGQSLTALISPGSYEQWKSSQGYKQATLLGKSSAYDKDGNIVYAYISGDITNAYDTVTVDMVTRSTMTLATGDATHPMAFIVYDRITSNSPDFKKTFLLHTMEEPTFAGGTKTEPTANDKYTYVNGANTFFYTNTKGASGAYDNDIKGDKYNGKLTTTTLLPENPTYAYIGGDGQRFWVNGSNAGIEYVKENAHPVAETGWGRVEISTQGNKTDSFLNIMYVSDATDASGNPTANTAPASSLIKTDTHEGAVLFNNVVMFGKNKTPSITELVFTAAGTGEMTYYIGGLADGGWSISVGGEKLDDVVVDKAEGMISFKAEAGKEIKITPIFCAIDYNANGGTISGSDYTLTFDKGDEIKLPTKDMMVYGYNEFLGWYTDEALTVPADAAAISEGGKNVTLYAKWQMLLEKSINAFSVVHGAADGAFGDYIVANGGYLTYSYIATVKGKSDDLWTQIRMPDKYLKYWIRPLYFKGDDICTIEGGTPIAHYSDNDTVDIVFHFDFENGKVTWKYYVNGEYLEGMDREGSCSKDYTDYNYSQRVVAGGSAVEINYLWQYYDFNYISQHEVKIYAGNRYE